jgi:hypothetical protein
MNDIEKYKNKKVYMIFDKKGNRKAIGGSKNIYISINDIKKSLTHQKRYYDDIFEIFNEYTIRTYELKDIGEEISIEDFIKKEFKK